MLESKGRTESSSWLSMSLGPTQDWCRPPDAFFPLVALNYLYVLKEGHLLNTALIFLLTYLFGIHVYECFTCMHTPALWACLVPQSPEEGTEHPETGFKVSCKLPWGCWTSNPGPPKGSQYSYPLSHPTSLYNWHLTSNNEDFIVTSECRNQERINRCLGHIFLKTCRLPFQKGKESEARTPHHHATAGPSVHDARLGVSDERVLFDFALLCLSDYSVRLLLTHLINSIRTDRASCRNRRGVVKKVKFNKELNQQRKTGFPQFNNFASSKTKQTSTNCGEYWVKES